MKRTIGIIIGICFANVAAFSQELPVRNQRDSSVPVKVTVVPAERIKNIELSKTPKKQVKKYKKTRKKVVIKSNTSLTPEQKKKIIENNKVEPRRGVTNLPNERTTK